jgi:UDP-glucuronate 4-epimerase
VRLLITGGVGFIGSHLSARLLADGHRIAIIDDFNDFYDPQLKENNLEIIRAAGSVALYRGDIRNQMLVNRAFEEFAPEVIVHLAARAGVRPSLAEPLLYEKVNVGGTVSILEAARRCGTRRFVFASSSSVYGIANRVPFSEDDLRLLPISPYAATKIAGEKLAYTYSHLYGLKVVCLRFFTVYGPRQRPDLAIRKFMQQIEAGQPVPFFGDGTMGRDYTFVTDIVDGVVRAITFETAYDVFNLGNSAPISLNEMVETIAEELGKQAILSRQPIPPGDVPITFADLSRSHTMLGYAPQVSFRDGIRRMVEWFRQTATSLSA